MTPTQRYRVTFAPEANLSDEELRRGIYEAAIQLHSIREYPWPGQPEGAPARRSEGWSVDAQGHASRICESWSHATQLEAMLGIVEGFVCEMEPVD